MFRGLTFASRPGTPYGWVSDSASLFWGVFLARGWLFFSVFQVQPSFDCHRGMCYTWAQSVFIPTLSGEDSAVSCFIFFSHAPINMLFFILTSSSLLLFVVVSEPGSNNINDNNVK